MDDYTFQDDDDLVPYHESHLLDNIESEIGDILWYLSSICTELGIELDFVAKTNINKLFDRLRRNKIKGNGDNR